MRLHAVTLLVLAVASCTLIAGCPQPTVPSDDAIIPDDGGPASPADDPNDAGTTDPNDGGTDPNDGGTDPNDGGADPNDGGTDPNDLDPNDGDPNDGDPNSVDPNDVDPNDVDPNDVDPNDVDPNDVDPNDVDPNDVDPNDVDPPTITGTYADVATFDITTFNSLTNTTESKTHDETITVVFDANSLPKTLLVPAYQVLNNIFFEMPYGVVGTEQTFTDSTGGYNIELTVTIDEMSITGTTGHAVFRLVYDGQQGGKIENGTGTHTVDFELTAAGLVYESSTHYDVSVTAPIAFSVEQDIEASLTLTAQ